MTYVLFILGFILLIKGADLLVEGASSIAKKFNVSPFMIGLTIVAFGTSAPELIIGIIGAINGQTDLVLGNILGTNVVNVLIVLGITSIIYPIVANKNTVWIEIPFGILAMVVLWIVANDIALDGGVVNEISRIDGIIFLGFFLIFLVYTFSMSKKSNSEFVAEGKKAAKETSMIRSIVDFVVGLIGLIVGADWIVDGATNIALNFGISENIIGLTIVAVGTSLPEIATSIMAALRKDTDIAIGNITGSCVFNVLLVLGVTTIISPINVPPSANIDIFMATLSASIFFLVMLIGKKYVIERWQGIIMIVIYAIYLSYLIFRVVG